MSNIEAGHSITTEEKKKDLALLDLIAPHAEMFIAVTPAVRTLIEAESVLQ